MERHAGLTGTFLIAWAQTLIDGHAEAPEEALAVGAYWRWSGSPVDIGAVADLPEDMPPEARLRLAREAARRIVGRALGRAVAVPERRGGDLSFTLSDGRRNWVGLLIDAPGSGRPLLLFDGAMPPADFPLRVDWVETGTSGETAARATGLVCFTPGTWIATPGGARQIEHLAAGDKVMTLDGGAQELVWTGTQRVTLRELTRMPEKAPVRIREGALGATRLDGDLVVSPDHRMLLRSPRHGRGEAAEILVAARDLVDGGGVTREPVLRPVIYVHLLLERHHVLLANGFETESFHPAAADLSALPEADHLRLLDVMPMLRIDPHVYGACARPALSQAEAALLTAA